MGGVDDEIVTEVIDWSGDPEKLIAERLTPKALEKLWAQLDSDNPNAVDKAIDKAIAMDKRLRKDAIPQGNTLNVFGQFDPEYLKSVGQGLRQLFGGTPVDPIVDVSPVDKPKLPPRRKPRLHGQGVEDPGSAQ